MDANMHSEDVLENPGRKAIPDTVASESVHTRE